MAVGDRQLEDLEAGQDRALDTVLRVARDPLFWRGVAALALAALLLVWPDRSNEVLWRLLGIGVGLWGLTLVAGLIARKQRPSLRRAAEALLIVAIGGWMIAEPDTSFRTLAGLLAVLVAVYGIRAIIRARDLEGTPRVAMALEALALLIGAALVVVFPGQVVVFVAVAGALGIALSSAIGVAESLRTGQPTRLSALDTPTSLWTWLLERPKSAGDRRSLYEKILYEGEGTGARLLRFVALMAFASVIAASGVLADSTAVVIGGMLIAPLMTPLMATAMSLVMGWPARLARAVSIAVLGGAITVALSALLAAVLPVAIDVTTNSQITSRTEPTVVDLVIALAAGAAGAYALSRPDVSDSLPGVAVAIALVPPLSVVGIAWQQAEWDVANGALLLFGTNVIAILIMGGVTFIVTGVTPIERLTENQRRIRTWFATLAVVAAVVVGALAINGLQIARDSLDRSSATTSVDDWLASRPGFEVVEVTVEADSVEVVLLGPGQPDDVPALAASLSEALDRELTLELQVILAETSTVTSSAGS